MIADLRELDRRTGGPDGAQRLCWGEGWRDARSLLTDLLGEIGLTAKADAAGNLWASIEGEQEPALALGSHLDSVPDGGWLDGALGVMAALDVLRAWSEAGVRPPRTLTLVDWADEEGARFGRSLFGSSAFSGTLDPAEVRDLRDREGRRLADVLAENSVDLDLAPEAASREGRLAAYLELHIEQGPVLEAEGLRAAAVSGCAGVERHRFRFSGQASHAGTTPMDRRRDAGLAAAELALRVEEIARRHAGVATAGALTLRPGIPTAVAGEAELLVDLRHPEADELATMLDETRAAAEAVAAGARLRARIGARLADRADPVQPAPGRGGPRGLPRGRGLGPGADQRRAPRRRRGRPRAAGGNDLLSLGGRHQPRQAGGHPRARPGRRDRGLRPAREPGPRPAVAPSGARARRHGCDGLSGATRKRCSAIRSTRVPSCSHASASRCAIHSASSPAASRVRQ